MAKKTTKRAKPKSSQRPESTGAKHSTLFKPGVSGNPAGRPKGSRNKLGEEFVADLLASWQLHGMAAIRTVASTRPADYLKVIAQVIPKDVLVTTRTHEEALAELI